MKLSRLFTVPGTNPLDQVEYDKRRSVITNPDGSVVFEARDVEVPKGWSQLATDIAVSKYFRRAGVPSQPGAAVPQSGTQGRETSARQLVHRVAHTIRKAGEYLGSYFDSAEDA